MSADIGTRSAEQAGSPCAIPPSAPQSAIRLLRLSGLPQALRGERILEAFLAAGCAAALVIGILLTPSPDGMGTHTQLGIQPCGMWVIMHKPCPTCGVTTSFALASHGRFVESAVNQPFGLVVFVVMVAGLLVNAWAAIAGRTWFPLATVRRVSIIIIAGFIVLAVSWAYKWSTVQ
jgi:hypothetical protein